MHPYALNGRPTAFWRGDWYVGKGIAHAALRIGPAPNDIVDVFNTHTHPAYASSSSSSSHHDSYSVHRAAQAWQLAKLLRAAASVPGHLVVAAGDFNMTPLSTMHRVLTGHAPVRDVWRVLHPESSLGANIKNPPTAAENLTEHGATSNTVTNTWRWSSAARARLGPNKPLHAPAPATPDPHGHRLDYIFASTAAREVAYDDESGQTTVVGGWVVRDARVGLTQRHPELGCSLSDHFAVEATLVFHTAALMKQHDGGGLDDDDAATTVTTTAVPSLSGWPLPPGRLPTGSSNLNVFRRSGGSVPLPVAPAPPTFQQKTTTAEDAASVDPDPAAFNGAFLSLHSATPSLSHQSSHSDTEQQQRANANSYRRPPPPTADFDTQLLSSLYPASSSFPSSAVAAFAPSEYTTLLTSLSLYTARENDQTRLRTAHFAFSVFTLVACCIAAWFIPITPSARLSETQIHAVNFVLVLLSGFGLVAGVVDGLLALLFFAGSERRALREFEWDLRNAKRIALGEVGSAVDEVGSGKYD